ncbi:helix-turn-helix domain-containing protein [Streptomyces nigrescens]|uniref:helix-turn-helix domain-containing protein n=1 Tax=Streptomyces nigrescens TaxID=1920 RepID=UPI002252FEDD|nr:helix-turn-helix transcriptional regulator [Streptomyces libani]MCX5446558.1 helix-turn-helix transcriptional regulator [Streptomyces libani]
MTPWNAVPERRNEQGSRVGTETEGFAGLLRLLKERSGRSYGVLAGQLHMSVSTLHRYCNGDAVPMDFAPADRLARRCGATADELVELHRRWILADEARRRSRATSAATKSSPAPAASSTDEPATSSTHEADASADAAGASAAPAADTSVGMAGASVAAADTSADTAVPAAPAADTSAADPHRAPGSSPAPHPPHSPPAPHPQAAPDSPATPASADESPTDDEQEVVAGPMAVRRGPGRRALLRIVLAVSAVAAVAVPAALAVEERTTVGSPRKSAQGEGRTPAAGGASTRRPESPSPGRSSEDRHPAPDKKARPSTPGSARSDGSRASRAPDDDRGGSAPQVGISSYNWDEPCGVNYLLQQTPDHVPPPPRAPQDTRDWARALGGVGGGHMLLQLTATGNTDDAVVLTSLNVRVVGKRAALSWPVYALGDGCGSGVTPQTFDIDLDDSQPLAKPVAGQDGDVVVPAKNFPFKVSTRDPQVLNLNVHTEGHDVSWYLEVGWSSGGQQGTVRVNDGGKPFRTSAIDGREKYAYWPEKKRWNLQ